jgi:hypothetical protein
VFLGSASYSDQSIHITASKASQTGGCFLRQKVDISRGFMVDFSFRMTQYGADGMAFVVHNDRLNSIGSSGCGLGYSGISNR